MTELPDSEADQVLSDVLIDLKDNIGGYQAWLAIGWIKACIYSSEIFEHFNFFPILFVYGKYQCGKNTLVGWLTSFFGLGNLSGESIQESTQTGISRMLSYYSSLPVWMDEPCMRLSKGVRCLVKAL